MKAIKTITRPVIMVASSPIWKRYEIYMTKDLTCYAENKIVPSHYAYTLTWIIEDLAK